MPVNLQAHELPENLDSLINENAITIHKPSLRESIMYVLFWYRNRVRALVK